MVEQRGRFRLNALWKGNLQGETIARCKVGGQAYTSQNRAIERYARTASAVLGWIFQLWGSPPYAGRGMTWNWEGNGKSLDEKQSGGNDVSRTPCLCLGAEVYGADKDYS
jgi:hypothetical protein